MLLRHHVDSFLKDTLTLKSCAKLEFFSPEMRSLTKTTRFVWNECRQKNGSQNNLSQGMIPEHLVKHNSRWKVIGANSPDQLSVKKKILLKNIKIFSELPSLKGLL